MALASRKPSAMANSLVNDDAATATHRGGGDNLKIDNKYCVHKILASHLKRGGRQHTRPLLAGSQLMPAP